MSEHRLSVENFLRFEPLFYRAYENGKATLDSSYLPAIRITTMVARARDALSAARKGFVPSGIPRQFFERSKIVCVGPDKYEVVYHKPRTSTEPTPDRVPAEPITQLPTDSTIYQRDVLQALCLLRSRGILQEGYEIPTPASDIITELESTYGVVLAIDVDDATLCRIL